MRNNTQGILEKLSRIRRYDHRLQIDRLTVRRSFHRGEGSRSIHANGMVFFRYCRFPSFFSLINSTFKNAYSLMNIKIERRCDSSLNTSRNWCEIEL